MFTHKHQIRVRYSETDQMGYLYYGNYASFLEEARVEAMRSLGIIYADLEKKAGILMPVASMETKFIRPAYYDSLLTLETQVHELPDRFFTVHTNIYNEKEELINKSKIKLAFINKKFERVDAPKKVVDVFRSFFE